MRSLFLTGLAAGGLLFFAGCNSDDVKKVVEDVAGSAVVFIVNGTGGTITADVEYNGKKDISSHNRWAEPFLLVMDSSYDVSHTPGGKGSAKFRADSENAYLYAATDCSPDGFITDQADGNRVHVVNLTANTFTDNIIVKDANGRQHTVTDNVSACNVVNTAQLNDIVVGNGMKIKIGSGAWMTVTGIPPKWVDLAGSIRVDVVIYSSTDGTIVPMASVNDVD